MKKGRLLHIFALAALVIGMVSACTSEEIPVEKTPENNTNEKAQSITIRAKADDLSRAVHGTEEGGTSFLWEAGVDKIGLMYYGQHEDWETYKYWDYGHHRFTNTVDGENAVFVSDPDPNPTSYLGTLMLAPGDRVVASYPYGTAITASVDETNGAEELGEPILRNSLGALLQHGDNNTEHLYHGDYMFSKPITLTDAHFDTSGNVTLDMEFGHIFSKMRFTVKNSTAEPLDISSIIYRSTKEDDVMQGTLYLNSITGQFVTPEYYEWGDIPPSNSAVLEVEDVTVAPGATATLWMWLMPLDFTEGNSAGRKADIMVNTSKGVFRVQETHFESTFKAGSVYRHGLELTDEKLLSDYAYVSDPNFVKILYNMEVPVYDLTLNRIAYINEEDDWDAWWEMQESFKIGSYIRITDSEVVNMEEMEIQSGEVNALSLDGLQYFTGLKKLSIEIGQDMSNSMTMRALKLSTLTELEELDILQAQIHLLDLSENTKLKYVNLGNTPRLEKVIGLGNLTNLEAFNLGSMAEGGIVDMTGCSALKSVSVMTMSPLEELDLSGLDLDYLSINIPASSFSAIKSIGTTCKHLVNHVGAPLPDVLSGVEKLELYIWQEMATTMIDQFSQMTGIKELEMVIGAPLTNTSFTSAQASIEKLSLSQDSSENGTTPPTGWSYLTGVNSLGISGKWSFTETNPLDLSGMASLTEATIQVGVLKSFAVPASLKTLDLNVYNPSNPSDITFTPTGVETLSILTSGKINVGGSSTLKELDLTSQYNSGGETDITLGSYPNLEVLKLHANGGNAEYANKSFPKLKTFVVSGKYLSNILTSTDAPNLEEITLGYHANAVVTGVGSMDLRGFTKLNRFVIGTLDLGYAYRNYNNRYGPNSTVRGKGAFVISETQYALAKAGAATQQFTGIILVEDSSPTEYQVNQVYKVVNASGDEVTIADSDGSDGEITTIVKSNGN